MGDIGTELDTVGVVVVGDIDVVELEMPLGDADTLGLGILLDITLTEGPIELRGAVELAMELATEEAMEGAMELIMAGEEATTESMADEAIALVDVCELTRATAAATRRTSQ